MAASVPLSPPTDPVLSASSSPPTPRGYAKVGGGAGSLQFAKRVLAFLQTTDTIQVPHSGGPLQKMGPVRQTHPGIGKYLII